MPIIDSTNISILKVRNAIGCPSTDLGCLCTMASIGGNAMGNGIRLAFKVPENEIHAPLELNLGDLMPDALPYWNIFAVNSPGQWYKYGDGYVQGECRFRIKMLNAKQPEYSLGSFAGHDSEDAMPSIQDRVDIFIKRGDTGNEATTTYYYANLGDYPFWNILGINRGYLGIALYKGTTFIGQGITEFTASNPPNLVNPLMVTINISKANAGLLKEGDKLLPRLYIQEIGQNNNDNFRYFIRYIEPNTALTNVIIDDVSQPIFGGLTFIDKDNKSRRLTVNKYTLTRYAAYATMNFTLLDYSSLRVQEKDLFYKIGTNGDWKRLQSQTGWPITLGIPTDGTFIIDGGIQAGVEYYFLITEGIMPR